MFTSEYDLAEVGERAELERLLALALHIPLDRLGQWMDRLGYSQFRVLRRGGSLAAGLGLISMGQWFGGQPVPATGVTAVGVAPELRGAGVGRALLCGMLDELFAAKTPLATLYPATLGFYRGIGFERAGKRISYELPLALIAGQSHEADLAPLSAGEYPTAYALYRQQAERGAGLLERPEWMWNLRLEPPEPALQRYLIRNGDHDEGYVVYSQAGRDDPLTVHDVCILTPAAGRRLLALFADHRTIVQQVIWKGGELDPLAYLLHENLVGGQQPRARRHSDFDWMLRIVDVPGALMARGYPPELRVDLALEVDDELLPANTGRWLLRLADGRGYVERGGDGRIRLNVRDLAAIYTGFMTPAERLALGAIRGAPADLALLAAVFAGPRPWIQDMF